MKKKLTKFILKTGIITKNSILYNICMYLKNKNKYMNLDNYRSIELACFNYSYTDIFASLISHNYCHFINIFG